LYVSGITAKKAKRLVELNNEIYEIDSDRVSYQNRINEAKKLDVKLSDKLAKMGYRTARLGLYREEEKLQKAILKYKKEGIALKYDKQIADLQYRIKFLQLTKGNLKDIWSLQVLINSLSIERQKELANLAIDENELMAISNKTLTIETNRLALLEQQKRALIPIYDAYMRIKESVMTVNELISDSVTNLASGLGSGVGTIMTDLTGGFQEQQQEVIDLQGELKELDAEYKNAISEGNVEEAANLKKEMAALNTEISDLEDPIKNIGEAFKDMLKGVVDGIREVINQWIAMQIITGIMKAVIPTPSASGGANIANYSGGMASYHATGGLLPNVKSFKRFSNGGVTDDLTMAVLGDNASKKEIVIPTENISKNNVSGHMQESGGDTYIINAVTERDLAMALSKPMPGKVIVNRVYADLDSRGKIARKLGG